MKENKMHYSFSGIENSVAIYDISTNNLTSYATLNDKVKILKNYLIKSGVKAGHKVCIYLENNIDYIILFYALNKIEAVCIPLSKDLFDNHLKSIIGNLSPDFIIKSNYQGSLEDHDNISLLEITKFSSFNLDPCLLPADIRLVAYTSGSTSSPKGVLLTNTNLKLIPQAFIEFIDLKNKTILAPLSMEHMYGFSVFLSVLNQGGMLCTNTKVIKMEDLNHCLDIIDIDGIFINAQNIEYFKNPSFLSHPHFKKINFVSSASFGLSPLDIDIFIQANKKLDFYTFYALSEVPRATCFKNPHQATKQFVPIGKTSSHLKMLIQPLKLNPIGLIGTYGEIAFQGNLVAAGYILSDKKGISLFSHHTISTGDIVKIHEDGLMEYVGRISDLICINGTHFISQDIEKFYSGLCCIKRNVFILLENALFHLIEGHENNICDLCQKKIMKNDQTIREIYKFNFERRFLLKIPTNTQGKVSHYILKNNLLNKRGV